MPDFPVISPGLITCCRPRLSLTSLPRPCPGYYRSLLSLTTSLITCCRPRLSLTSLPRLCPGYYRSPLSLTTSSPISSWLLTCSAPWLHSSSRLPVLHLGPHHTRAEPRPQLSLLLALTGNSGQEKYLMKYVSAGALGVLRGGSLVCVFGCV